MSNKPVIFDDDNPEWTEEDFARAQPPSALPAHILAAFPNTPQNVEGAEQVSIRLDGDLLRHFRGTGPGWQGRVNDALRKAVGL